MSVATNGARAAAPVPPMLPHPMTTAAQVWSIVRPWRRLLLVVVACVLLGAGLELVPPLLVKRVVDDHLAQGRRDGLLTLGLLYFAATAAVQGTSFLTNYLTAVVAQGALHALRVRLYTHYQRLPLDYFDQTPLGDVISRCTADIETVNTLFTSGVATLVAELIRLVTVAAAMLALSAPLAVLSVLFAPPVLAVTRFFQVRVRAAERATRRAVGSLNVHLQETFGGVEVIRAFGRDAFFIARCRQVLRQTLAASNVSRGYGAVYSPLMNILSAAAIACLLWAGTGGALASWDISLGTLTAFVLLFQRFFAPITSLGDNWQQVQSALSGAERVFQVLALPTAHAGDAAPSEAPDHADQRVTMQGPIAPPLPDGADGTYGTHRTAAVAGAVPLIALRDVVFGYLPDRPVLHGVSLGVAPGEHVALVGRTGAGKTSALHLAAGLYAPWAGAVWVAGRDPYHLRDEDRRTIVGVVPQAVQLFRGTVRDNLTLHDPAAPQERVRRAAEITGAAAFIEVLPQGYATVLSGGRGGGTQLSAGQRQLLALTRALVGDPAVLLLDEATAAIDGASDAAFRAALRRALLDRGHAVLTVAHRLSTAREADRVVVLEAGRVIEDGTPQELILRGGRFAVLVALEEAGWDWQETLPPPSKPPVLPV